MAIAGFSPAMAALVPRSSCLCFQFSCVEAFSFLPNDQGNRRDFARQSKARHLRLDAAVNPLLIKILQRSSENAGTECGTFEDIFQIVIVVYVESADQHLLA